MQCEEQSPFIQLGNTDFNTMSQKTVAVVGATGLFGKSISLALLELGHKVIAITRSISSKEDIIKELEKAGAKVSL